LTVCSRCRRAWLNLVTHQKFDCRLKLTVLGGIDERIDTAADERQGSAEVVEFASDTDDDIHDEVQANERPASDESATDHQ